MRIDRRLAIKWIITAGAGAVILGGRSLGAPDGAPGREAYPAHGYGTDPDVMKPYKPGDYWPLVLSDAERGTAAVLCDIVIPADSRSPGASSVGVVDFVDEWVSAPYPGNVNDRPRVVDGLAWLDAESTKRFGMPFTGASQEQRIAICEDISADAPEDSALSHASRFFRLFRDLVARGYYTTPVGMKEIGYVGNVPLAAFEGPPADLIARLGVADEVKG